MSVRWRMDAPTPSLDELSLTGYNAAPTESINNYLYLAVVFLKMLQLFVLRRSWIIIDIGRIQTICVSRAAHACIPYDEFWAQAEASMPNDPPYTVSPLILIDNTFELLKSMKVVDNFFIRSNSSNITAFINNVFVAITLGSQHAGKVAPYQIWLWSQDQCQSNLFGG